jgi:hypothetical protein
VEGAALVDPGARGDDQLVVGCVALEGGGNAVDRDRADIEPAEVEAELGQRLGRLEMSADDTMVSETGS